MDKSALLEDVITALGITGNYQDNTLMLYIDEVTEFLIDAGVTENHITVGIVSRGVTDLWNYGSGEGKFSDYFLKRAVQLSYKKGENG